jgi:signal transduction histidine kinase/CheY-like chemotaxis protein
MAFRIQCYLSNLFHCFCGKKKFFPRQTSEIKKSREFAPQKCHTLAMTEERPLDMVTSHFIPYFGETTKVKTLHKTLSQYLGESKAQSIFKTFAREKGGDISPQAMASPALMYYVEQALAAHIGDSSAHLILALILHQTNTMSETTFTLFDETIEAVEQRGILQNALDHAKQGITVIDKNMVLVAVNKAFIGFADLPPRLAKTDVNFEQIVRYNAEREYYGKGDVEELVAKRLNYMKTDSEPRRLELFPHGKDKPSIVIEMVSNQLPDGGVITTYTDISLRVRAEEELAQTQKTLDKRVIERTKELEKANKALAKAKAFAEEANASKTRFLAAASHDIQQPLHAARLFAETLLERDRERGDSQNAERVCEALDGVDEIINALFEISKLDTGAVQPHISNFRLDEILGPLEREFRPQAEIKKLDLRFVKTTMAVRSDRHLLRRALQNLISNAIKYTVKGKVLVGVRLRPDGVEVNVCDTGLGIPENKRETIFEEFERLDEGKRTAKGLGLGLSIVDRILKIMHHPITLQSMIRRGSVFRVMLPLSPILPEILNAPLQVSSNLAPVSASLKSPMEGMIILTIDDEKAIRDGMESLLGKWGCKVITAESLRSARILLKELALTPDIIIADYNLGPDEGNGIEAITALRWAFGTSKPAILLTSDDKPHVVEDAQSKGIYLHHKPVKPAVLRALLTQWGTRSHSQ